MKKLVHRETSGPAETHVYDFVVDGQIVGFLQIRLRLSHASDVPPDCASHIYYEIRTDERMKGYGTDILFFAKREAKNLGLKELIVTCDESNLGSRKIIESNGGILVGSCLLDSGGRLCKYQIGLSA